jgi:hypothetical protein
MTTRIALDAFLGFLIAFSGTAVALITQEGGDLNTISTGALLAAFLGALGSTAKVLQSRLADSPDNVKQTNAIVAAAANLEVKP